LGWLQALAAELGITLADSSVWWSIGQGLLFGAVCLLFGILIARFVGLLRSDAPAGETLGVGLASGLLVLAAWWAAIASGGRSSFTPVAVGFAIALGLAVVGRWRRRSGSANARGEAAVAELGAGTVADGAPAAEWQHRRNLLLATIGATLFVVAVALLYGSTLTLSPRDGVQPLEFNDGAFYSVLGADLAKTGTETIYSPSGFDHLDGLPTQTWYHWGEIWLASVAITMFGMAPVDARHFVVLPILLLAAAALTGTVVRRMTGSASRGAFLFAFLACLFLAPVPLLPGPFFSSFARGLIFGISAYGLAAVAVLLAMYGLTVVGRRHATWALAGFAGSAAALIVPAHLVIALLAMVGVGTVWTIRIGQSLVATRRLPVASLVWRRTFLATAVTVAATVVWGILTGHSAVSGGASPGVTPFAGSWRGSVAIISLGAGAFLAIGFAWYMVRRDRSIEADLYLGTAALVVAGALAWGALLADIYSVHLFFAAIVIFATPAAAVAVWSIWRRLRATGHVPLAIAVLVLCATQLLVGGAISIVRLQEFGPRTYSPVPIEIMDTIKDLPAGAKLAYACAPSEEVAFWEARLLGIDARTGHRMVPMCFQAETSGILTETPMSADAPGPMFGSSPQHSLYPDPRSQPSPADIDSFLRQNGIDYIYADAIHPDLVSNAIPVTSSGQFHILRLP
jgi:hypothetical protein